MIDGPARPASGATRCQISSVTKGIIGVDEAQHRFEHLHQGPAGAAQPLGVRIRFRENRLRKLQVPVAVLVPGEVVDGLRREVEAVLLHRGARLPFRALQQRQDPPLGESERDLAAVEPAIPALGVEQHEAGRVPELVAEVAVALDAPEVEADVAPLRGQRAEREPQRIGAVGGDPLGELAPGRRDDLRGEPRLHQAGGALGR